MLLFSQLPTARPQQQPVVPPSLEQCLNLLQPPTAPRPPARRLASRRRPPHLDLPLPHDLDLQQSAAGRHPPLLGLASGARNEGRAGDERGGKDCRPAVWSRTELRNHGSSSVFGLQRAGFQGLLQRSRLPASRLAGLRVEPELEPVLEPCQIGPKLRSSREFEVAVINWTMRD